MVSEKSSRITIVCVLTFQIILIILFAIFVKYGDDSNAITPKAHVNTEDLDTMYPLFQDVHVMIFIGFGFLMTFLKKYGFSSVGLTMLIASIIIQWGLLCRGFFRLENGKIPLDMESLVAADVVAATILISFGAILGKVSVLQLFIMGIIETILFCANEYFGLYHLQVIDAGGSMFVHVFGAYFGLTVSMVIGRGTKFTNKDKELEGSSYNSDLMAMIGTVFLWLFWPSFNGALVSGDDRYRAIINTYLSLAACCVTTFFVSSLFDKHNKFDMVHIQNATLAGGVCIGTAANLMVQPYGALIIGAFAGLLSTSGFRFMQSFLLNKIGLHDTCGVNNLHGMPGLAAGLIGAIMAALADEDTYGISLYETFPAMSPMNNSLAFERISAMGSIPPGDGRSAGLQAAYQIIALVVSFIVAVIGGLITGQSMKCWGSDGLSSGEFNDDAYLWKLDYQETGVAEECLKLNVVVPNANEDDNKS